MPGPHGSRQPQQWENQQRCWNHQCQFDVPPVSGRTNIEFSENIQKMSSVRALALILIKNSHTDQHPHQQTDNTQIIGSPGDIISRSNKYPSTNVEWLYIMTLWQPSSINVKIQPILITKAAHGETILETLGPTIKIAKIPTIHSRPWCVRIPKSAWRSTRSANRKTTPATLLSDPKIMLYKVTRAKQNALTR